MWYWIFDPVISDIITALVNWEIVIFKTCVHNSFYILIGFFWNFICFLSLYEDLHVVLNCWAVSFKVTDEALLAETAHYGPYCDFL